MPRIQARVAIILRSFTGPFIIKRCWTIERKHKDVTAAATKKQNLENFEESVYNKKDSKKHEAVLQQPTKILKKVAQFLQNTLGTHTAEIYTGK